MKVAILSDIHGNMDALEAVLHDVDLCGVDAIYSLGDNIGYGAEPERVVRSLAQREIPSILGNHELALIRPKTLAWFNPVARQSLKKNFSMLSAETVEVIRSWRPCRVVENCRLVHGFPMARILTYLFEVTDDRLVETFQRMVEPVCFVGHTHELKMVSASGETLEKNELEKGVIRLDSRWQYLFNIGSVGQPRDGNNNAKYGIWDSVAGTVEIRYVPYDFEAAAEKIIAAGLPASHADRLM